MDNGTGPVTAEKEAGSPAPEAIKYYHRRWWILFVFSLLYAQQCNQWITFGPISSLVEELYTIDINLLAAWGPIVFIPMIFVSSWLLDTIGLRWTTLLGSALVAVGGIVRCITDDPPAAVWLVHLGQIFNAAAGPIVMGAPPLISAVWFPLSQRTLSTAIITQSMNLGTLVGFGTSIFLTESSQVYPLLRGEAVVSIAIFLMVIVYFPAKPPPPPIPSLGGGTNISGPTIQQDDVVPIIPSGGHGSAEGDPLLSSPHFNASAERKQKLVRFWKDILHIIKIPAFDVVAMAYGVTSGVVAGWQAVLVPLLEPLGYTQVQVGRMGCCGAIGAMLVAPIAGRISDWCHRKVKPVYLSLYAGFTVSMLLFCLIVSGVIPNWLPAMYMLSICIIATINVVTPVVYELAVDITFPVTESTSCGILVLLNNVACLVFLLVGDMQSVQESPAWLNWAVTATGAVVFVAMLFLKWHYPRQVVDDHNKSTQQP